jgi:hypothetical protein
MKPRLSVRHGVGTGLGSPDSVGAACVAGLLKPGHRSADENLLPSRRRLARCQKDIVQGDGA